VVATALVIAIGVAVFAGLGGMRGWREQSARDSFATLAFHDVRVSLAADSFVRDGRLAAVLERLPDPSMVSAAQERLVAPTQIDAAPSGREVFTPGRIVGVPVASPDRVDLVRAIRGRTLQSGDANRRVAVIDRSYANFYDLPTTGTLALAGGATVRYVGQGQSPQYFLITSDTGFGGESTLGVLFMPLDSAQQLAGRPGQVNELELRLAPGTDPAAAKRELQRAFAAGLPDAGASVTLGAEEPAYRILFRDAKNDQRMMTFFGLLVLLGACIAAFNLVSRTVEAERREIGIGMALGAPTPLLALRPLMLGAEIALLGTVLGALLTVWIAGAFASVYEQLLPLPAYADPFRPGVFARGALVCFALSFGAIVWPVWRGVTVQPIEAIRVGFRSASGGGLAPLIKRLHLPGGSVAQMAFRNAARTPRRTLLAVVGLAGVIGAMVALVGIVDSFNRTIDQSESGLAGRTPDRINVTLDGLYRTSGPELRAIARAPGVSASEPRIETTAAIAANGHSLPVVLSVGGGGVWQPAIEEGAPARRADEIVIAHKAAEDLGVGVGDTVALRRPVRRSAAGLATEAVRVRVTGIDSNPFRVFAYMPAAQAGEMGLAGVANAVAVVPEDGVSQGAVQRGLFKLPGVATTRPVTADTDALGDTIDQFKGIIQVAALAAVALALLMAFNIAGISIEERRREYATMFAYGLPVRSGLRMAATENMIIGVLGTLLGIGIGMLAISWITGSLMAETWPELGIISHVSAVTGVLAVVVGVVIVSLTPLLMPRRMTRMDIPSTLRVVE
jgi:putative ABC transport system permease protein